MDPWSKGDYSWHIREALMVVEKPPEVNPPSSRVSGRVCLAIPRSKTLWWQNSGENCVIWVLLKCFGEGEIYRRKGASGGPPDQAARWCGPTLGHARRPP